MDGSRTIYIDKIPFDATNSVEYHTGGFPPDGLEVAALIGPITDATAALAQFDSELKFLPRSELLLAPLRQRDAVVSSRMEGTISTLEEVLKLEANADDEGRTIPARQADLEVALYARALKQAEGALVDGYPFSPHLIRAAHRTLLFTGLGAAHRPGELKTEQNYVGDKYQRRIDFIPIAPEQLPPAFDTMLTVANGTRETDGLLPLIRVALIHAEFEALHPFEDGNGRLGRMLIALLLWKTGVISAPHFFVSDYFERNKDEYISRLRAISAEGDWTGWCVFFLTALEAQAHYNLDTLRQIRTHYEDMRERFRDILRSRWSNDALDYMFANPIFRNNRFKTRAGIPDQTANNFTKKLVDAGILKTLIPPAGRAPGLYAFPTLLKIVSEP